MAVTRNIQTPRGRLHMAASHQRDMNPKKRLVRELEDTDPQPPIQKSASSAVPDTESLQNLEKSFAKVHKILSRLTKSSFIIWLRRLLSVGEWIKLAPDEQALAPPLTLP